MAAAAPSHAEDGGRRRALSDAQDTQTLKKLEFCKSLPFTHMTITAYIPSTSVGALIGRKGSKIAQIEKQAAALLTAPVSRDQQVRVSIVHHGNSKNDDTGRGGGGGDSNPPSPSAAPNQSPPSFPNPPSSSIVPYTYTELDFSSTSWTPVVIKAAPMAALFVAHSIDEICADFVSDRSHLVYTVDLPISYSDTKKLAFVIGKRGQTIMQLSADHACRIFVPPKQAQQNIMQLEAPLQGCCSCLQALGEKFSQEKSQEK